MNRHTAQKSLVNIMRGDENCGMGFLSPGDRVITARHCVNHALETRERLVDVNSFLEPERKVRMQIEWFDEEMNFDVAVLKPIPGHERDFRDFAKHLCTTPVEFSMPPLRQVFSVHLCRRDEGWADGVAELIGDQQPMAEFRSEPVAIVYQGTSGTPVFNDVDRAIGVAMLSTAGARPSAKEVREPVNKPPVFTPLSQVLRFMQNAINGEGREQAPVAKSQI